MIYAQWALLVLLAIRFLRTLRTDFEGRTAKEPEGFRGAIITIIAVTAIFLLYWCAGTFSLIF